MTKPKVHLPWLKYVPIRHRLLMRKLGILRFSHKTDMAWARKKEIPTWVRKIHFLIETCCNRTSFFLPKLMLNYKMNIFSCLELWTNDSFWFIAIERTSSYLNGVISFVAQFKIIGHLTFIMLTRFKYSISNWLVISGKTYSHLSFNDNNLENSLLIQLLCFV